MPSNLEISQEELNNKIAENRAKKTAGAVTPKIETKKDAPSTIGKIVSPFFEAIKAVPVAAYDVIASFGGGEFGEAAVGTGIELGKRALGVGDLPGKGLGEVYKSKLELAEAGREARHRFAPVAREGLLSKAITKPLFGVELAAGEEIALAAPLASAAKSLIKGGLGTVRDWITRSGKGLGLKEGVIKELVTHADDVVAFSGTGAGALDDVAKEKLIKKAAKSYFNERAGTSKTYQKMKDALDTTTEISPKKIASLKDDLFKTWDNEGLISKGKWDATKADAISEVVGKKEVRSMESLFNKISTGEPVVLDELMDAHSAFNALSGFRASKVGAKQAIARGIEGKIDRVLKSSSQGYREMSEFWKAHRGLENSVAKFAGGATDASNMDQLVRVWEKSIPKLLQSMDSGSTAVWELAERSPEFGRIIKELSKRVAAKAFYEDLPSIFSTLAKGGTQRLGLPLIGAIPEVSGRAKFFAGRKIYSQLARPQSGLRRGLGLNKPLAPDLEKKFITDFTDAMRGKNLRKYLKTKDDWKMFISDVLSPEKIKYAPAVKPLGEITGAVPETTKKVKKKVLGE